MVARPGLDEDQAVSQLVRVWEDAGADLDRRSQQVQGRILALLAAEEVDQVLLGRLRAAVTRLEALGRTAEAYAQSLANETAVWLDGGGLHRIYQAGAGVSTFPFTFTQPHAQAVELLAKDLFGDVLKATTFVARDSKRFTARVSKRITERMLTQGESVGLSARTLERAMTKEFATRGVGSVVYANGARHSFGEYGAMLIRTKTGNAYNAGTIGHSVANGVRIFQLFDGPNCGLTSHADPELANGLLVTAETAAAFPLAHPGCVRAMGPRPDLSAPSLKKEPPPDGNQADVLLKALDLATTPERRGRGRVSRAVRGRRRPRRVASNRRS